MLTLRAVAGVLIMFALAKLSLAGVLGVCAYRGKIYGIGESFPAGPGNGCNTCTCEGPELVKCTNKACASSFTSIPVTLVCPPLDPGRHGICVHLCDSDEDCSQGQKCCSNGCGMVCQTAVSLSKFKRRICRYNGAVYKVGENFLAGDGCNTCTCTAPNQISCTEIACKSDSLRPIIHNGITKCPLVPITNGISSNCYGSQCSADSECPLGKKCCRYNSNCRDKICRDPVFIFPQKLQAQIESSRVCYFNGVVYSIGEEILAADDECNVCECVGTNSVSCKSGSAACSQGADESGCPPDKPLVNCLLDPCRLATCPAHPDAKCKADYCGGCNARFLKNRKDVTESCEMKALPQGSRDSSCPPDKPLVACFANPCVFETCPERSSAECIPDFCGGCNARFYENGVEVTDKCVPHYD